MHERLFAARLRADRAARRHAGAPSAPHFAPKAKHVIYLFMAGAPSQLDLFDYKPSCRSTTAGDSAEDHRKGERFAFIKGTPKLLGSPFKFRAARPVGARDLGAAAAPREHRRRDRHRPVDDDDQFNHAPAQIFMNTGHPADRAARAWARG